MVVGGDEYVSDTLVVSPARNFHVGYNCGDEGLIQWEGGDEIKRYILFGLGEKYLEPVYVGADTAFFFKASEISEYFALAPVVDGKQGKKSFTFDYRNTGANCYYRYFDAASDMLGNATLSVELTTFFNENNLGFEKKFGKEFIPLG